MGGQVTLSTTANTNAITGNPKRVGLTITNIDSTNIAYLQPSANYPNKIVAATAPIAIGPGLSRSYTVAWQGATTTQSVFQAICTAGTPTIVWEEQFP